MLALYQVSTGAGIDQYNLVVSTVGWAARIYEPTSSRSTSRARRFLNPEELAAQCYGPKVYQARSVS